VISATYARALNSQARFSDLNAMSVAPFYHSLISLIGVLLVGLLPSLGYVACVPELAWTKSYDDPTNANDQARGVAVDGSGNVVVVGGEWRGDLSQSGNWLLRKYDAAGNLLWSQDYNNPGNSIDLATGVAVDGSGNVVVVGDENRTDLGQGSNWRIRKYDAAGNLLWSQDYNNPSNSDDSAFGIAVDGSGNVVVVGLEVRNDLGQSTNGRIRKYDAAGNLLWSRDYNTPGNEPDGLYGVAVDGSGNVVVVGVEWRNDLGQRANWLIRKYDAAGNLLWSQDYNSPANNIDAAFGVAVDGSGNVVVVGEEDRTDLGQNTNWLIRKYDAAGNLLWSQDYNSPSSSEDHAYGVAVDGSGNVVVVGEEWRGDIGQSQNWRIRKYDPAGNLVRSQDYNSPANNLDIAYGVAVDGSGNVLVAGVEWRNDLGQSTNWRIRKYGCPAELFASVVAPIPTTYVGEGFLVTLTVTNTGIATATGVETEPFLMTGNGGVSLVDGPTPGMPVSLAEGAAITFTWTFTGTSVGTVIFTTTVNGTDAISGASVSSGPVTSNAVRVTVVSNLPAVSAPTAYPIPFNPAKTVGGVMNFANLPPGATVRIYSVAGLLMWEGRASSVGTLEWNGRSRSNRLLEPGVYLWLAEAQGFRHRSRLVIER